MTIEQQMFGAGALGQQAAQPYPMLPFIPDRRATEDRLVETMAVRASHVASLRERLAEAEADLQEAETALADFRALPAPVRSVLNVLGRLGIWR